MSRFVPILAAGALVLGGVALPLQTASAETGGSAVRLLGMTTVPKDLVVDGTPVGGISGIDYDRTTGDYVLLSDDRSERSPSRFYRASIDVDAKGLHGVDVGSAHTLLRPDGTPYPDRTVFLTTPCTSPKAPCAKNGSVDPESVRVDPDTGEVLWSTEGEREVGAGKPTVLQNPQVRVSDPTGATTDVLPTPRNLTVSEQERGARRNATFEGLGLTADGDVVTSMEGPIYQDGPLPTTDSGAVVRFTVTERDGSRVRQFGYRTEPLFAAPEPADAAADQGVSEILADPRDPDELLVVERAFSTGKGQKVRLFTADMRHATDISKRESVSTGRHAPRLVKKRLLADLDDLGLGRYDNIEGATWGPKLRNGSRTLLLVSDDNFSATQESQVIALAIR